MVEKQHSHVHSKECNGHKNLWIFVIHRGFNSVNTSCYT